MGASLVAAQKMNPTANGGDMGSIPTMRKAPGEGNDGLLSIQIYMVSAGELQSMGVVKQLVTQWLNNNNILNDSRWC